MSASPPPSSASGSSNGSQHQGSDAAAGGIPLSANDRRERNKAASAKYRAKKHYQSGEMRTQITTLQDHNNVLTRQLEECRTENTSLKNLVEKLKGRLVAEKVLKRLREVGREKKRRRGGATNVSAHDLSMSDSDTDDVVDAVGDDDVVVHDEDEDNFDDEERVEIQRRQRERKSTTRRRVARPDDDDEDYHDS
ncbi:hypothetical protein EDD11_004362 [Mortierella claussenii]|nr:hypothetical protein EDD11_004362 [Mortierella claussenii]